ncbi:MAG TPA: SDR family NAD(P)-dependent oxidoreductase [bacterium]|jgi:NAD(P)-dependent dehydrogenase (short-subunit alcohol dehydrogenase family)|nr:SDR family NAD(P)-dependent oxidoreductase [bacterium]
MSSSTANAALGGKTAVVTGASSGIGREIARGLARQGATVVMACRNAEKAGAVREELARDSGNRDLSVMLLDLASLASVRAFAAACLKAHPSIDILVNNAGGWTMERQDSADGMELIWATNVLGPELLTRLLLPGLRAAGQARIVNLSSTVAGGLDLDDVEYGKRKFSGFSAYSQSKQADRMLTWALADELGPGGVTANAMSPGLVKTDLNRAVRGPMKLFFALMLPLMGKSPAEGADTAVWLASSPEVAGLSGKFFENRKEIPCKFRADKQALVRLSSLCARMAEPR